METGWIATLVFVVDLVARIGFSVRVVLRRLPVGVSLAWLTVILVFPFAGSLVYLVLGEYRLGRRRIRRVTRIDERWPEFLDRARGEVTSLVDTGIDSPLPNLIEATFQAAPRPGNSIRLLAGAEEAFSALLADLERAQATCDMAFYIWAAGGRVDEVASALVRAVARGVRCRLLLDAQGSAAFLRSPACAELRRAGVQIQAALPTGILQLPFVRPDLRLHRKIALFDGGIGYTGSLNMADPRSFKQEAGVGEWVDALARIEGLAVSDLAASFLLVWAVEAKVEPDPGELRSDLPREGPACIQVLPSGPLFRQGAIESVLLSAIYSARHQVTLTSPYFVPSESLQTALRAAAASQVRVTLIVPAQVDQRLVQHASRAYQCELIASGVRVALFEGGLLHTKSISVDDRVSLFGSLNLDPRSMHLNFELTLTIYDRAFTADLIRLQESYLEQSRLLDLDACRKRPPQTRLADDAARLLGPVL